MAHKSKIKELAGHYAETFKTCEGAVLKNLREKYGERSSFDENPYRMAHKEGQRSVYLDIMTMLELVEHPERFKKETITGLETQEEEDET